MSTVDALAINVHALLARLARPLVGATATLDAAEEKNEYGGQYIHVCLHGYT